MVRFGDRRARPLDTRLREAAYVGTPGEGYAPLREINPAVGSRLAFPSSGDMPVGSGDMPVGSGDMPVGTGDMPVDSGDMPVDSGDMPDAAARAGAP